MADTNALTIPVQAALVTKEIVDQAYEFYRALADQALEGMVFHSPEEREAEIAHTILQLVESTDAINDNVRQRAIDVIARYQLYHHTPEGWEDLRSMIHDACPELSPSQLCEHLAIADTIAPWCEQHSIELEMPPNKLGYLREAASALRQVIKGPLPNGQKSEVIQEELDWLFNEAPSRDGPGGVRDRYRNWRGVPAKGIMAEQGGQTIIVLSATPATATALRQKISRLVEWDISSALSIRRESGTAIPSKLDDNFVQDRVTIISLHKTVIIDGKTGEVIDDGQG